MTLDEQRDMIERALGERMLNHAFVVLHQWLQELGFEMYGDRLQSLEQNYDSLFRFYLNSEDPDRDQILDYMTGLTYRLVDEIYVDICLKRGKYPQMVGYDRDNIESVLRYFGSCPRLRDEDYDYLRDITVHEPMPASALLVMAAVVHLLKDCFVEQTILCLIEALNSENRLIADQAMVAVTMLLVHYDIRIDYFPDIQNAYLEAIGDGEKTFRSILSLIVNANRGSMEISKPINLSQSDDVEGALEDVLNEQFGEETEDMERVVSWIPSDEADYYRGLANILPGTWLIDALIGEDENRQTMFSRAYLEAGNMELWWDNLDEAEILLTELLRSPSPQPRDYINYGHICFLKGDKLMAYENYREARRIYGSAKQFLSVFRPDRRFLVDHGLTLEEVYLMEDQLLKN